MLRMLDILEAVRGLLASGDPPPLEDWEDIVNFLRVFVDRCHHGKEERALFPAMMLVADDRLKSLMEELLVEHVESRGLVAALAAAAGTDPVLPGNPKAGRPGGEDFLDTAAADRAIAGYVALVRPHVMREEEQLYPAADGLLAGELQESLQGEYDRIAEETIGQVPGAFEKTIVRLEERYLPRQEA